MAKSASSSGGIEVPALALRVVTLQIVGDSPLIMHKWSDKAREMISGKQQGEAVQKNIARDPQQEFEESMYRFPDGRYGFPSVAFKAAAVDAATQVKGLTKTYLRGAFHTQGELTEIVGEPRMREDMVRIGMGTADIRWRAEFPEWSAPLRVRFNENSITIAQLVHLFNAAGFSCGLGEWRPQKDGSYGMFHVEEVIGA